MNGRLETHALAGGYSVSQRGPRNWLNNKLSRSEAEAAKREFVEDLGRLKELRLTAANYVKGKQAEPGAVVLPNPVLMTEQQAVESVGATYVAMGWIDHLRPDDETLDTFVEFVRETLPGEVWSHVHCNGGRGRTTTMLILYDMARNADRVEAEMIILRMSLLSGDYNMSGSSRVSEEKQVLHKDRQALLLEAHAYFKANPGGLPLSWSQRQAQHE